MISVGQIIDHTWDHYRDNFVQLISLSAWLLIVFVLNTIAFLLSPVSSTDSLQITTPESIGVILFYLTNLVIAPIVGIWMVNSLIKMIHKQFVKQKQTYKTACHDGWKFFWSSLWVRILFGLVIFLGTVFFVVPGIIFLFWFAFALFTLLVDGKRGHDALKESKALVAGRWWSVVWRLILPKALFFLIFFFAQTLLLTILNAFTSTIVGLNIGVAIQVSSIFSSLIFLGLMVLFNPLFLTADYILYDNLKKTK